MIYSLKHLFFFDYASSPLFTYLCLILYITALKNEEVVKDFKLNEHVSNLLDLK